MQDFIPSRTQIECIVQKFCETEHSSIQAVDIYMVQRRTFSQLLTDMLCLQENERVKCYYDDVIPVMTVDTFKSHFRMRCRRMDVCKLSNIQHAVHFIHCMKMHNNSIYIFFT